MGWTKGDLVEKAFGDIGMKSFNSNLDPDVMNDGLRTLDMLMAFLDSKTVHLGYPMPSSPGESRLVTESNLPDYAIEPVVAMLAVRLAPGYGKVLSIETKATAKTGMNTLMGRAVFPQQQQLSNTVPRGAGNKPWRYDNGPFMPNPTDDQIVTGPGGNLDFIEG